jgi:hypothetical protein
MMLRVTPVTLRFEDRVTWAAMLSVTVPIFAKGED